MGKKRGLFCFILLILAVAIVLLLLFWDAVLIRVAPKYVLRNAANDLIAQMQLRFSQDPLLILADWMEPDGKYTADLSLDTANSVLGPVHYNMTVQTNSLEHQFQAQGSAAAQDTQLDLSLYVSPEYMAISSDQLVGGTYYGLTFDTFRQDIRSIPLLDFFITGKMISQWDSQLQDMRNQILQIPVPPQIPKLSEEQLQAFLLGLLALPCEVEDVSVSEGNILRSCRALTYQISADQLKLAIGADVFEEANGIRLTFYLYQRSLLKVQLDFPQAQQGAVYELYFGEIPFETPPALRILQNQNGALSRTEITVDTQYTQDQYSAFWKISQTGKGEVAAYQYFYQPSTGATVLTNASTQESAAFSFREQENKLLIESENFSQLFSFWDSETQWNEAVSGTICVTRGSEILPPSYKNLNEWTFDDFWALLTGIGSLLGIILA